MRASCQFARDHVYLDDRSEQGHDKPLELQSQRLRVQALTLVMSAQDYVQPCQGRSLSGGVVGVVEREEKREEVDDDAEGREQAVSQSHDVRSCRGSLVEGLVR